MKRCRRFCQIIWQEGGNAIFTVLAIYAWLFTAAAWADPQPYMRWVPLLLSPLTVPSALLGACAVYQNTARCVLRPFKKGMEDKWKRSGEVKVSKPEDELLRAYGAGTVSPPVALPSMYFSFLPPPLHDFLREEMARKNGTK
jgi:hypothetical protein